MQHSPVDKLLKWDAVGVALSADVHRLQDARVAQLHHDPLPAETQCLPVVVGFDAAHKVWLAHHHLRQQVHQGVLQAHSESATGQEMSCHVKSHHLSSLIMTSP